MKRRYPSTGKKASKPARRTKPKTTFRLRAGPGHFQLTGHSAELVLHARQVMGAMNKLSPGDPLTETDREEIRRALAVLTDGEVGGIKFKLKDPKGAKRRAWQKLKHYAEKVADKAAEQIGKRVGDAAVDVVRLLALAEALKWFLG